MHIAGYRGPLMARILIAEDDPQASEMIARICEFKGHQVTESRDAVQALGLYKELEPDLVITDLAMPLGGGQHFVTEMRKLPGGAECPVIVITGYAAVLGPSELDALQPCQVLDKPLNLEPMLAALDLSLTRIPAAESNGEATPESA